MEAYKACEILTVMLQKLQAMHAQTTARKAQGTFPYSPNCTTRSVGTQQYTPADEEKPEHSAAITLGMLSSGGLPAGPVTSAFGTGFPPTPNDSATSNGAQTTGITPIFQGPDLVNGGAMAGASSPFAFFAGPMNAAPEPNTHLDWDAWDSYIQNANVDINPAIEMWPSNIDTQLAGQTLDGSGMPSASGQGQGLGHGLQGGIPGFNNGQSFFCSLLFETETNVAFRRAMEQWRTELGWDMQMQ
jgi:hypothetical protein